MSAHIPRRKTDPEAPLRAPLCLGAHSNGEYFHEPTRLERAMERRILEDAADEARHRGMDRRSFLSSTAGFLLSLSVVNEMACGNGGSDCGGNEGGRFLTCPDDPGCLDLSSEFIFDFQNHHVERIGNNDYARFLSDLRYASCGAGTLGCLARDEYSDLVFAGSDTTIALLSALPEEFAEQPLNIDDMAMTRDTIDMLIGAGRLLIQGMVLPNLGVAAQLAEMDRLVATYDVATWKLHTAWGPATTFGNPVDGYFMDDPIIGIPVIERGLSLGVDVFCVHKGFPGPLFNGNFNSPRDVGPVAASYPTAQIVVYHSALRQGGNRCEGEYSATSSTGVDGFINSMRASGIGPGENVFAELGSVWQSVKSRPSEAAHILGKLLLFVGEDNILWGTDAIWDGSPQALLESFARFEIRDEFQQRFGYPALTPAIKRKILGENAAQLLGINIVSTLQATSNDLVAQTRMQVDAELGERRWALHPRAGPRSRREFLQLQRVRSAEGCPG